MTGDRLWGQGHYHTDGYVPTVAEARGKIERVSGDMESIKKTQVALLEMKTAMPEIFDKHTVELMILGQTLQKVCELEDTQ